MRPSKTRLREHEQIEAKIADYLARGGKIQQCTTEDNASWRKVKKQHSFRIRHE